jgi:hypothetical protein
MTKLTVDPALGAKLTDSLEITDPSGKTLGFFLTPEEHARLRQAEEEQRRLDYEHARAMFTDEELAASRVEGGEYTYEEMWEQIRRTGDSGGANGP